MPTRMIRDGILLSERLNSVSPMAELHYRRLMSVVDDYGRYEAAPVVIRAACWSMRENVTVAEVDAWQRELGSGDRPLVLLYEVGGKKYLEIQDFGQRIRTDRKGAVAASRCPAPDAAATRGDTRRHAADVSDTREVAAERGVSPSCAASSTELASRSSEIVVSLPQTEAAAAFSSSGDFPDFEAQVRELFPDSSAGLLRSIAEECVRVYPPLTDHELCCAVRAAYKPKKQHSAALFKSTLPEVIRSWASKSQTSSAG